ncbi:hypothetical protein J6590_096573 [Homalodisca vitripennis]|nr:hypothetical protein J6590_096573 [Homalodisca vitripennis]
MKTINKEVLSQRIMIPPLASFLISHKHEQVHTLACLCTMLPGPCRRAHSVHLNEEIQAQVGLMYEILKNTLKEPSPLKLRCVSDSRLETAGDTRISSSVNLAILKTSTPSQEFIWVECKDPGSTTGCSLLVLEGSEDSKTLAVKVIMAAGTQAWFVLPMGSLTCEEALAVRNLHLLVSGIAPSQFTKLQCFIGTTHSPENNDKAVALQQIAALRHTVLSLMRRKMFTKLQCFIGTTHSPENNDKAVALQQIAALRHTVLSLMRRKMWILEFTRILYLRTQKRSRRYIKGRYLLQVLNQSLLLTDSSLQLEFTRILYLQPQKRSRRYIKGRYLLQVLNQSLLLTDSSLQLEFIRILYLQPQKRSRRYIKGRYLLQVLNQSLLLTDSSLQLEFSE